MRNPVPGKCSAPITEPELEEEEPGDDSGDISVPFSVFVFRTGRGVAGELLIDPGQRSPGLMRSFVLRSPGLKRFPSLMRSPDLVRSPGLMRSPILRSPVLRSTGLMRYPVMRAPVLRSPVLRPPDLMRSSDLNRSPGLMRSLVLKADSTYTSPLMRSPVLRSPVLSSPVLRSPVLYLYLEKFPDLSGVKELVSRPIIDMKFSRLRRFPGLKKFSGLMKFLVLYSYLEELGVQTSVSATCTQRLLTTDDLRKCVRERLSQERSKKFDPRMRILIPAQYPKAMGVQVLATLLNMNVLTGNAYWGVRWQQILESLRCYGLGDIMFGFVSYNVLQVSC